MIKTIIKRDGSKEAFNPNKVNGWGIWAAEKLGRYVDWASIVTSAISTLPEIVTSQELQESLIKKCIEQRTWEYNLMAGRLYASLLIRIIHDADEYPTIKEVQDRLVKDGLMRKLDYTDDEYEKLEKVINHDYNLKYPHYAIHQNRNKYSLKNRVTGKEYETSQFMYMRMAMALAEKEPVEKRLSEVKAYYDEFANHRINVPTPYYVNLGTYLDGYASCCIFQSKDDAPSLAAADHIAYMMTVMSAGIGYHLKTRSLGDSVRGGLIEHQGKLPYLRSYSTALAANTQCYAVGTSVLTNNGFIDFKDVTMDTLIGQVEANGSITFVKPLDVISYHHKGDMVQFSVGDKSNSIKSLITPNHRVVWRDNKHVSSEKMTNKYISEGGIPKDKHNIAMPTYNVTLAEDFIPSRNKIMDFGGHVNGNQDFTPMDALRIAYQADGTTKMVGDYCYSFHFSKDYKVDRLKGILDDLGMQYTLSQYKDGTFGFYVHVGQALTKNFSDFTLDDKSTQWCESFLEELQYWDGSSDVDVSDHVNAFNYCNSNLDAINFVQSVASACSVYTSVSLSNVSAIGNSTYDVYINLDKTFTTWRSVKKEFVDYDDLVYCVTVPSGMLVVKYNNNTMVSGNSGRGGSGTAYFNAFDPEIEVLIKLKNPITPQSKQIRGSDYSFGSNRLVVQKSARNEDIALFSYKDAPELYDAIYSGDNDYFERLYEKFIATKLPRTMVSARKIVVMAMTEAFETGRTYEHFTDWMNRHTPFLNTIWSSNLCLTGDTILNVKSDGVEMEMTIKDVVESLNDFEVRSFNIDTKKIEYKRITAKALTKKDAELFDVEVNFNSIRCTPEHMFYTVNRGYVQAADLNSSDILLDSDGDGIKIVGLSPLCKREDVYDITVDGNHNFFANDILVHNCSEIDLPTSGFKSVKELYESYKEEQNFIRFKTGRKEKAIYSFDRLNTKRQANIHALKLQEDDIIINDDGTETPVDKILERSTAGEIALCNIGGIIVSNIKNDKEYYNSCYRVLKMVRFGILNSSYVFQNLKETAAARMNAGIGIVGLAHLMAKKGLSYSSQEGRDFCHELAETHYWHLANASLELSKEYGVAKWMYKTKWVDGWTPLDTYCGEVDGLVTVENKRDWKGLSEKIKANGGILNSVLVAHMPSESCLESTTYVKSENGNMSLEDIFNLTGANLEEEVENITPLTGGKWFALPEPIMVETMDGLKPCTDVWLNGRTNYIEIELEDGAIYKVTHHHKFLVKSGDSYQWKMAINLTEDDEIMRME